MGDTNTYPLENVATARGPKLAWVAWSGKVFAVTQEIADAEDHGTPLGDNWRVTHRYSGHAMGSHRFTLDEATKWAQAVDAVPEFATATFHEMWAMRDEFGALTKKALVAAGLMDGVH